MELVTVFTSVFIAELGDKTQIATLLFAATAQQKQIFIFLAAASALVVSTGLAVLVGNFAGSYLDNLPVKAIAGIGFIVIGAWMLTEHFTA